MRLIIFFLLLSLGAEASNAQIIRANAFYRPQPSGVTFLLDAYPNAAAAYSLRKLKASYSGSAIRIRRDSTGNAETDIGFTANGDLDTAAIKTHCRNNSCMVTTWYNQGDSTAVNFTQTTAARQPRIMTSGVIERRLGQPTIRWDNAVTADAMVVSSSTVKFNYLHQAGQAGIFMIMQAAVIPNPNAAYYILDNAANATANHGNTILWDDRVSTSSNNRIISEVYRGVNNTRTSVNNTNNFYAPDTLALITNLLDNSNATAANRNILYRNGANQQKNNTNTGAASTSNASFNLTLGASSALSFALNGYISELIFYPTDQSSNRTGIETNINNYYGLW